MQCLQECRLQDRTSYSHEDPSSNYLFAYSSVESTGESIITLLHSGGEMGTCELLGHADKMLG